MKNQLPPPPPLDSAVKLPLWRACAEAMIASGIEYGDIYTPAWMAGWLRLLPEQGLKYGMSITKIRRELEQKGFYLMQKSDGSCIVQQPEFNVSKVGSRNKNAIRSMRRALVLASATDASALDANHQRLLASETEKSATRLALMSRRALA